MHVDAFIKCCAKKCLGRWQWFQSRVLSPLSLVVKSIYMSVCEPRGAEQRLCGEIWDAEKRNECPDTKDVENCWELG